MSDETPRTYECVINAGVEASRTLVRDLRAIKGIKYGGSDLQTYPIQNDTIELYILPSNTPSLAPSSRGPEVGYINILRLNADQTLLQVTERGHGTIFEQAMAQYAEPPSEPEYVAQVWNALADRFRGLGLIREE